MSNQSPLTAALDTIARQLRQRLPAFPYGAIRRVRVEGAELPRVRLECDGVLVDLIPLDPLAGVLLAVGYPAGRVPALAPFDVTAAPVDGLLSALALAKRAAAADTTP